MNKNLDTDDYGHFIDIENSLTYNYSDNMKKMKQYNNIPNKLFGLHIRSKIRVNTQDIHILNTISENTITEHKHTLIREDNNNNCSQHNDDYSILSYFRKRLLADNNFALVYLFVVYSFGTYYIISSLVQNGK